MQNEVVRFSPNVPTLVTLKFDDGIETRGKFGPQWQYALDGGKVMWVDPPVHDQIQQTGARAGDTVCITQRKAGKRSLWEVEVIADEPQQPPAPPPPAPRTAAPPTNGHAPAPRAAAAAAPAPAAQPFTAASLELLSAIMAAVEALTEAEAYAAKRGMPLKFTRDDIRAFSISIYINQTKAGRA
jgi:hypothetical protein